MFKLCILFFAYLFIKFALTIQFIRSSSISSSDDGPITNKSIIELSEHRSKRYLPDSEDRIIGGQFVKDFRRYPFMVYVRITIDDVFEASCTGTLISKTHVLTGAHCIRLCHCNTLKDDDYCFNCTKFKAEDYRLYFGNIAPANSKISRTVKYIHVHPNYKAEDRSHKCTGRFDIGVLELSTPVRYNGGIFRIKLPEPVTLDKDELNFTMTSSFFDKKIKCKTLGWGITAMGEKLEFKNKLLKVASVPLIGHDRCINFIFKITKLYLNGEDPVDEKKFPTATLCTDTSFCSKCPYNRNGFCSGDSGGPIICGGVQVGVVSRTIGDCVGPNNPNIYTRVDINVQWIRSIMSNKHDLMEHEY